MCLHNSLCAILARQVIWREREEKKTGKGDWKEREEGREGGIWVEIELEVFIYSLFSAT